MAVRAGSSSPGLELVYNSQEEDVDNFLAQYGGVSLSQGSLGQAPLGASRTGSLSQSLHSSPQRSPRHRSPRLTRSSHHHSPSHPPQAHSSPFHQGYVASTDIPSNSWGSNMEDEASVNYPTAAAEILDILELQMALLTGGRDRQGKSLITFPAKPKTFTYNRDDVRKVIQYLTSIPTDDVRENGFSVVIDARSSNWHNTKLILHALQEALPAQIHVVYIIQPGHFWKKTATSRGHNKEKKKLEFSTVMLSVVDKLIRHVESSQLTFDLGGFLPYNHKEWIQLRLKMEHFIASFNALMEHTAHVEQQLHLDQEAADVETAEEFLGRHMQIHDQLKKAPQNTIREGNELLRDLEQGNDEAGASNVTPDKINAVVIIRRLLDNISKRQVQMEDLWKEKKIHFEQMLQLRVFEKAMLKVRSWIKLRAEETVSTRSDIGESMEMAQAVQEQHERFEAKTRNMYNSLTQLRRMADRCTGANHFAADTLQRQVSRLSSRFSKFEALLDERRRVVNGSVRLHNCVHEWKGHCEKTVEIFKQDISANELSVAEQLLSDHNEGVQQLGQMAETIVQEANSLLELMDNITQRTLENRAVQGGGRGGGGGPDYSHGISHVERLVGEVRSQWMRVEQLAEARKLQLEQFKQLLSCEKDANQVTEWLKDMCQQMASTHGDIGESKETVGHIINEHDKFTETAKKSYKYGCDLLSAAQRTRTACSLDLYPNGVLLEELGGAWEKLSEAAVECRARLVVAQQFHMMSDDVMSRYSSWTTPIEQLPKVPHLVEEILRDMADNQEELAQKMQECIRFGNSLLDRLCHPLTTDPTFRTLNENTKHSLSLLRSRVEELDRRTVDFATMISQQQALLSNFLTYCKFEQNVEEVLLWLQDQGLKKMRQFSHVAESQGTVQSQLAEFESFDSTCKEYTQQVKQLHTEAPMIEAQIQGFQPELVRKMASLQAVWEKFLQRVDNRRKTLHLATSYYGNLGQLQHLLGDLEAALVPSMVSQRRQEQVGTYLSELGPTLQEMDGLFSVVVLDGRLLADLLRKPPTDSSDPAGRVDKQLDTMEVHKRHVEELWKNALNLAEQLKQEVQVPQMEPFKSVVPVKYSERYKALEEQSYKQLQWLESECDTFLIEHTQMGDSVAVAEELKTEYETFLETIEPTCTEIHHVTEALLSLKTESPGLASSIDQLCGMMEERVRGWRQALQEHLDIIQLFVTFSTLSQEADFVIQSLDDFLCQSVEEEDVTMDTAQQLLEKYQPLVKNLRSIYPNTRSLGEEFLKVTSGILAAASSQSGRARLAVGDACTSVAVELGELEGKFSALTEIWGEREKRLQQTIDWEAFKMNSDQICSWLKDSAEKFLQSRVDLGTSVETAEDLLMEHEEFQIRAKRIASEVESLLSNSEEMLADSHFASAELKERAWEMKNLHGNLQTRVESRQKALSEAITFHQNAEQLAHDMDTAIEACKVVLSQELPSNQRVSSVSTRLTNLTHQADIIYRLLGVNLLAKSRAKHDIKRSESCSASESAVKQILSSLVSRFAEYKVAVETRRVSPGRKEIARDTRKEMERAKERREQRSKFSPGKKVTGVRQKVAALNEKEETQEASQAKAKAKVNQTSVEKADEEVVEAVSVKLESTVSSEKPPSRVFTLQDAGKVLVTETTESSSEVQADEEVVEVVSVKHESTVSSENPPSRVFTLQDAGKVSVTEETEFSREVQVDLPPNKQKRRSVFISSATKDIDLLQKPRRRLMSSSSSYVISPSADDMRKRTSTEPTICRATIKQSPPVKKVSMITVNVSSQKDRGDRSLAPRVSASLTVKSGGMKFTGQVSSLRSMFDSKKQDMQADKRGREWWSSSPPPLPTNRIISPDIIPKAPARPEPPADLDSSASQTPTHAPPPRPPSPIGYYLDHMTSSSELESDSDIFESSEERGVSLSPSGNDMVDGPEEEPDSARERRILKSMSMVLAELLKSELTYLNSLEMLVKVYLPSFTSQHLPTFLQGRSRAIFANVEEMFVFQRKFYSELTQCETSAGGVCRCFIRNEPDFHCYVPYICNLPNGVNVLSQYGGTFFEDLQRENRDGMSLMQHYTRPKARLVEYNQLLKELLVCAQKEFLHGVSIVKDALRAVQLVLHAVDNAIALSNLQGCPFSLDKDHMIRMEPFVVYTSKNAKKNKPHESYVFLHRDYILFAQATHDEATDTTTYEYTDSLQTGSLQMIEMYKGHKDKFALFEGSLSSGSELYVLQPTPQDVVMKQVWVRDINAVIKKIPRDQLQLVVGEEYQPLPLSFLSLEQHPVKEPDPGWFGSLKRKRSFKGQDSIKRKRSLKGRDAVKAPQEKDFVLKRKDSKKAKKRPKAAASDQSTSLPAPGVADVQLATLAAGQFQMNEPNEDEDEDLYVVVESFSSKREEFLTVKKGQLVEVLDQGGSNWLVLTIPAPGELETEGFLPATCLRPAGEAGFSRPPSKTTTTSGHTSIASQLPDPTHQPRESATSGSHLASEHSSMVTETFQFRPRPNEFISQVVEDVYYAQEDYQSRGGGVSLTFGQAVEVLDISDGDMWLVKTVDSQTGKVIEGMVPSQCLVPRPPGLDRTPEHLEAETGQEIPQLKSSPASADAQPVNHASSNVAVMPNSLFGAYEPPRSLLLDEPVANLSLSEEQLHSQKKNLESTGQIVSEGLKRTDPTSDLTSPRQPVEDPTVEGPPKLRDFEHSVSHPGDHSKPISSASVFCESGPLSSSLHSLPATFNPPPSLTTTLGFNPNEVPSITVSEPELQVVSDELRRLQEAAVESVPGSMKLDEFDPVEVYVAIADFEATEEANISLTAGQHVQVLDSSRSDWWLVTPTDSELEGWVSVAKGWVPANYLERRVIEGAPASPPPSPFIDETGELGRLVMKGRSPSDIAVNRRELYRSAFLVPPGVREPEEPSEAQLQGVFSINHPYMATKEIQAEQPGQLSLVGNQLVNVLDSKRDDWWLVQTMPEDGQPGIEGWVPGNKLQPAPYIREDSVGASKPQLPPPAATISPSSPPRWVVLADYQATESGMLTVYEGELVEVIDISRNEWCLVRPIAREAVEGWVPATYLKPYDAGGYTHPSQLPPKFRHHSSPDESDTSADLSDPGGPTCFSPEVLEAYEDEDKRAEAEAKRRFVLSELASSERDYVEKLEHCIENYVTAVDDPSAPKPLKALQNSLFANLSKIYTFHKQHFLPALLECESDPTKLGDTFESAEEQLRMYITYCKDKSESESLYQEFSPFFEEIRSQLRDRLNLPNYLILPVQRITKYNLLLADFNKNSIRAGLEVGNIDVALRVTRGISTQANNAVHLSLLEGVEESKFGKLVLQDVFAIQEGVKQLFKERRVFLFEHALIISKKRRDSSDRDTYAIKEELLLSEISMAQDMDGLRRNIIIYDMLRGTKFILRASKMSVRDHWLSQSADLIQEAKIKVANMLSRQRTSSDPNEYVSRSPSLSLQRSTTRRDREKRNHLRPLSSSGFRMSLSPSPEEQVPEGTEYVVMECIVMEGGDDIQLEPGEVVELVRVEGVGSLRVRTKDEHSIEGNVPTGFLRRKDSVREGKMETTPKFTMTPADMTLKLNTTAIITCAFNGYPNPSVVWRKDKEILTAGDRIKITSCPTSSVMEIIQLQYEDAGAYTCYITNQQGSESSSMVLSIHGPPTQPLKPTVSKVTSNSLKLRWPPPEYDGGSPVLSYQIEMLQLGIDQWQPIVQQPRNNFTVKTLEPSMSYKFRVIAYNEFGASRSSEPSDVVSTKGKGWFIPIPGGRKPSITSRDYPDAPIDHLGTEETFLSPRHMYIRRGSVSSMFDVLPEELGRGRFGIVHKCVNRQTGAQMAAKYVRLRTRKKPEIRREVEILLKVTGKSPYILLFQEAFERGRNLIMVTELIPDGELIERIIEEDDLTEGVVVGYIAQLLSALECIHNVDIAHLDIKPENILLAGPMVKLIDFGCARELTPDVTPPSTSSPEFCSPEVVNMHLPTLASDLWSVGVLTYVLLSGISPFFVDNIQTVVERVREARYDFYSNQFEQISQDAKDFIAALLQKSPEYRMTATQARQHIWISTLGGVAAGSVSPWPMARLDTSQLKSFNARRKWHTMSVAVDPATVFGPRSILCASPLFPNFEEMARNESPPQLLDGPAHVRAPVGTSVSFQYQVSGSPEPTVSWEHEDAAISSDRVAIQTSGGVTSLTITNVTREDEGVYMCCALNSLGSATMETYLTVLDTPGPPSDVNGVILGSYNTVLISWLPPASDGNCSITQYILQRRRIEFDMWEDVSQDESTAHVVEDLIPGLTYIFRVAAINEIGIGPYSKPSPPVVLVTDTALDGDSPAMDVRLKNTSFDLEYELGEEIGRGMFAVVRQCTEKSTDRQFAAKLIPFSTPESHDLATWEFEILHQLVHPRIVGLEDAFESEKQTILVLEYLSGGSLQSYLAAHTILSEPEASRLLRKVMEGLQFIHDARIIHVNLTPDNILLTTGHNDLRISDFGLARYIETGNHLEAHEIAGSTEFMAPEVVSLQPLTTAADIWSVGAIAYLMLTGKSPFVGPTQNATIANITALQLDTECVEFVHLSPDCKDFILERVLVKNPRRRLKAPQCQRHRWLQDVSQQRRYSLEKTLELSRKQHPASTSLD